VIKKVVALASWLTVAILLFFTLRRWLFIFVALLPGRSNNPASGRVDMPPVLLLVPVRNEAHALPELVAALDRLQYPAQWLTVVFINDGSTDRSEWLLSRQTKEKANWHLLSLPRNVGKANALNTALACFTQGQIVAIYDADERPQPDALRQLVRPFAGTQVGGVSGRRAVSNCTGSPAASYTTFEGLVHQFITMRAKDRLNLAPAMLGANCAYRRRALAQVGNFKPGALLEDSDLTLKLARAGWQTRFEPLAVSYHRVPESIAGYWKQHTRWARGFNEVARAQAGLLLFDHQLPPALRLELLTFSLGYLDRLALLAGLGLSLAKNRLVAGVVALSLLTPLVQVLAALKMAGEWSGLWRRVIWMPLFFGLDVAMAVSGFWDTLRHAPQIWEERQARK